MHQNGDHFEIGDYIILNPVTKAPSRRGHRGPHLPFHIAYDLAEGLVSRGRSSRQEAGYLLLDD